MGIGVLAYLMARDATKAEQKLWDDSGKPVRWSDDPYGLKKAEKKKNKKKKKDK